MACVNTGKAVHCTPAVGKDGTVVFGSYNGFVYAVNPDCKLKWSFKTNNWVESSPAIDGDGTVYIGSSDGKLYAINADGTSNGHFKQRTLLSLRLLLDRTARFTSAQMTITCTQSAHPRKRRHHPCLKNNFTISYPSLFVCRF